jgi:hypothetical protein
VDECVISRAANATPILPDVVSCYRRVDSLTTMSPKREDSLTRSRANLQVRGPNEVDLPAICTPQILARLQDLQNEVLASLRVEGSGGGVGGGEEEMKGSGEGGGVMVPSLSYQTPPAVLARQLIVYDRGADLIPLLGTFARRSLGYGEGALKGFDFAAIERATQQTLLATARPLVLQVGQWTDVTA